MPTASQNYASENATEKPQALQGKQNALHTHAIKLDLLAISTNVYNVNRMNIKRNSEKHSTKCVTNTNLIAPKVKQLHFPLKANEHMVAILEM